MILIKQICHVIAFELHGPDAGCQSPNSMATNVRSHHRATPTSARRNSPTKKRGAMVPKAKGASSRNCRGLGSMGGLCGAWAPLLLFCAPYTHARENAGGGGATGRPSRAHFHRCACACNTATRPASCTAALQWRCHPVSRWAGRAPFEGLGRGSMGMNV